MNFVWRMIWNMIPVLQFLLIAYSLYSKSDFKVENEIFTRVAWVSSFTQR